MDMLRIRTVFCNNKKQRCTVHLQRDAKHLARKSNDKEAKILYGKLSKLLHRARIWSVEEHPERQRKRHTH